MKKLLIIIFVSAIALFAQENNKGRISLVFNNEKIDLPINTITIMKQNNILVSVRAEHNDSISQQMVSLELGYSKLSTERSEGEGSFRIDISTRDNSKLSGKDLSVWYDSKYEFASDKQGRETAHYGVFNKGEKVSWEINSLSLRINTSKIIYDGNNLKIVGEFSGTFRSTLAKDKEISEIKDGKFEIII